MIWLKIISILVFVFYVFIIWIKYGIQKSISDSYYILPKKTNYLFPFFCWGFAIPAMIIGTIQTNNGLMFFAGAGICFVGAACAMREKLTRPVHLIGAYGGVLLSQISIVYDYKMWYVSVLFIIIAGLLYILNVKNKIWWVELIAFLAIYIVII